MKVSLVFILLFFYHENASVQSMGIRIGTSGKIGLTGFGGKIGSSIGSTLANMPSIRIGASSGGHGFGSNLHLPSIKLGSGGLHGGIASHLDGLPSIKIGGGSSSVSSLVGGLSGGSPFDSQSSPSSPSGRKMYIPVPVPIAMPSYQRPMMPRPYPQPMSYSPPMYKPEVSYRPQSDMDDLYKMIEEYKPDNEEEYKVDNYKELSGYEEDKPEKYSMDDEMTDYKKEKKYKPSKDMEYKMEDDDSKYGTADDGKYEEEEDSKYKSSYKPKEEYGAMEDSYSSPQPPMKYSADDIYKADDEYKPAKDERKYPSSDDSSSSSGYDNPYRSLTTSHKNLNSGQQDYMTLVGKQFDIKPRYNSVPPSTLPPHAQQNKAPSNSNNNNDYPSSIQQQLRQIHSKSPSSYNRSPERQNNDNYEQPASPERSRKPAAQSYPVPARAQSYPPRQNSGYPPSPVKAMQYASEPLQQEYEPEDQPAYQPKKKTKSPPRRPVYDEEEDEYERPRRTRKSRKMRRPDRYEEDEEEYPAPNSKRRRPTETYEEEEYEVPKSSKNKKKRGSSSYAESHEAPLFEVQKSVDDYIRSSEAGGSGLRRNRYEAAGSSSAFSFATAPHEFTKLLLGDESATALASSSFEREDRMPDFASSLLSHAAADRRDSVDEEQQQQQQESPDSRPVPAAQLLSPLPPQQQQQQQSQPQAASFTDDLEMERKFYPSLDTSESKMIETIIPPMEERKAVDRMMLPKKEVLFSITKAITEAVGRNQEVYDAIGSSRVMSKFEEIIRSVEAANYPHPYVKSNPVNPLAPAPPHIAIQQVQ